MCHFQFIPGMGQQIREREVRLGVKLSSKRTGVHLIYMYGLWETRPSQVIVV